MTLEVLKNYGIQIETKLNCMGDTSRRGECSQSPRRGKHCEPVYFKVKGNQKYSAHNFSIEGDYSNAAFIDAFNYFGNDINLTGLNPNSLQSDKVYKKYFDMLSKNFSEIDISNCIDLGPVLITFAALKNSK